MRVLTIGVDPDLVDFTAMPELDAARVRTTGAAIRAELAREGFAVTRCVIDLGEAADAVLTRALTGGEFDCVVIGAGVRVVPEHLRLFERVINLVHRLAPGATICFNTDPSDTVAAVRRGLALRAGR
ncbi:hypothetical protein E1265_27320 [Streptomyces sp. 8K308]|uniref:hypothetical protein n=1 Tax=Streptomyces sp. 8K308 TaxID=2530388 RepID=UPI00104BCA81|nr:hypothetical protein [Streptomyces sp. 8K308]TDC15062.1 hypothetical protein E1265_27320 [Streptomyces sp. 8K308]